MRKDFVDSYKRFIEVWGENAQMLMAVEEMSELTKEICKFKRLENRYNPKDNDEKRKENLEHLREEIADVLNMAEQLEFIFGEEEIEKIRKEKIDRTLKIINGMK